MLADANWCVVVQCEDFKAEALFMLYVVVHCCCGSILAVLGGVLQPLISYLVFFFSASLFFFFLLKLKDSFATITQTNVMTVFKVNFVECKTCCNFGCIHS